jgi:hypothetical protein
VGGRSRALSGGRPARVHATPAQASRSTTTSAHSAIEVLAPPPLPAAVIDSEGALLGRCAAGMPLALPLLRATGEAVGAGVRCAGVLLPEERTAGTPAPEVRKAGLIPVAEGRGVTG